MCVRLLVERVLQDTCHDLRVQCSSVDRALSQRCAEMIEAKTQLEMKLRQVHRRSDTQADSMAVWRTAQCCRVIVCADLGADRGSGEEHRGYSACYPQQRGSTENNSVQTLPALPQTQHGALQGPGPAQVHTRTHRDSPCCCPSLFTLFSSHVYSLEGRLRRIDATLASLRQQLSEARGSLSHLEESRITIEKDIRCKTKSLFIDREKCMTLRQRYPDVITLLGYWRRRLFVSCLALIFTFFKILDIWSHQ